MRWFGPRFILDEGTTAWIFDTYAWALETFGTDVFHQSSKLILPNNQFFPDKFEELDGVAESLFKRVREYAGMEDWQCQLVAQEEDLNPLVAPTMLIQGAPSGPAGTFAVLGGDTPNVEITYNPSQLSRPHNLVATFAHELAHYLIHSVDTPPPGGEDLEEHATDLVAVFMGFGVFLSNSAFSFNQFADNDTQGWEASTQGYLSEIELTYCLAVFMHLKELDREIAEPYLDKHLRKVLKKALKEMKIRTAEVDRLRGIRSAKMVQSNA